MNKDGFELIADDWKQATWEVLDSLVDSQWPLPFGLLTRRPFFSGLGRWQPVLLRICC